MLVQSQSSHLPLPALTHFSLPLPFQIAHTPRLTQDQAANQQRIRRLQRPVNYYYLERHNCVIIFRRKMY